MIPLLPFAAARWTVLLTLSALCLLPFNARGEGMAASATALKDLDGAAYRVWIDGAEQEETPSKNGPNDVVWNRDSRPDWQGVSYGKLPAPGPRHLRIPFHTPVRIGSVVVRGGGALSVLKPDAAYPGDLGKDADWIPAERLDAGAVTRAEVGRDDYAVWTLPPGTTTRALRFTHTARPEDPKYEGWLGGVMLMEKRIANLAGSAIVSTSSREEAAGKLTNGSSDGTWKAWDNGANGAAQPVSPEHPEWILLTWPRPVTLNGLVALWTGFGAAEAQIFSGPDERHPREANERDWKTIQRFEKLPTGYPMAFWPNMLAFGQTVSTRAVRLRLTGSADESSHGHLKGNTKEGRRVWLGELFALTPLGDAPLQQAVPAAVTDAAATHPPIAVRFTLPEAGFVTLAIEDAVGKRVRNLVSETQFPAGDNVAWWDGTDDLGRDTDAARHGLYHIPEQPVAPGMYRVRGLWHRGLDLRYEFSIYNSGSPAWETEDKTGGWLTNHTPPQAALFVPADRSPTRKSMVYLGSAVSEGGAGLAWVDLDGRKLGGRGWVGGNWTAAPYLARDDGDQAVPGVYAYVGSTWTSSRSNEDKTHGELRITALTEKGDQPVAKHPFSPPLAANGGGDNHWVDQLGGLAVRNGVVAASLTQLGKLMIFDGRTGAWQRDVELESPRGIMFDRQGRLLALSGARLVRFDDLNRTDARVLVKDLEDPRGITLDAAGNIYVSDRGNAHQVKVFSPDGKLLGAIGRPGAPKAGPYEREHMNNPHGMAIDEKQQLWVAENDFQPKRVSVWSLDGKLLRAFYGPGRYGGGGALDPQDKTRFYYDGIEFRLNWEKGTSTPVAVLHRSGQDDLNTFRAGAPEFPIHLGGRQYMTNCFNSNPTGGASIATLWVLKNGIAEPVAAIGRASDWELLKSDAYKGRWPEGTDLRGDHNKNPVLFAWCDLNDDRRPQPEEVVMTRARSGGATVLPDLAVIESRVETDLSAKSGGSGGAGSDASRQVMRYVPVRFTAGGAPVYDLFNGQPLAQGVQAPASSGGDQTLLSADGWTVTYPAPQPFAKEGFGGVKNGVPLWQYPNVWPGLHASHEAALPDRPGEVIGATRLLGGFITPRNSDAGPLWCVNGNMGDMYLFTADGLFVAQLFQDSRLGKPWSMPKAERGMRLNDLTLHDENFFPTIAQTADGTVYLCDGARTSLVRIDGLENVRRIAARDLRVTPEDLAAAQTWRVRAEALRQQARGSGALTVSLRKTAPQVDGKLDDWANAQFAVIDRRGTAANFNSDSKPYDISGAVAIWGDRLYAAWRTQDAELLKNSGETPNAPFKTGGCLDVMIGANPGADPKRPRPVAGDERLLITQVKGKTAALLYRAVVPGTREPVPFSSPARTITLDRIDDLSADVQLATTVEKDEKGKVKNAFYEVSVPLAALGLKPAPGQTIKGDIGILRGNGFQTLQRVYWNNKATAITADVPSEAELTPALRGKWELTPE